MRLDEKNNMVEELYELERKKIPLFLRMTYRKKQILKVLIFTFSLIEILIICWFPRWYGAVVTSYGTLDDGTIVINGIIPSGYITAIIIGLLPFILILLYVIFVYLLEKTAYSNANRIALDMSEDRRLFTREKDRELISKLRQREETSELIEDENASLSHEQSIEEEIDI